jgi:(2R)-3-sulfolactate dehydrogenase (NADP+)
MSGDVTLDRDELVELCRTALLDAGASAPQAAVLAEATAQAEERGLRPVGVAHLLDYLDGFRRGRIAASAPRAERRTPVAWTVDCREGLAQHGYDQVLGEVVEAAATSGLAVAALSRCYTVGELGYYVRALTSRGLVGLAFANSPALMSVAGSGRPVLGTNPLSFGLPLPDGRRVLVDQASSATAWVNVRAAAERGDELPAGVAVDPAGVPTTSAADGLAGALLPFGGYKGGNIALLVELLATMAGGHFSSDAPPFHTGDSSPGVGCLVLALSPATLFPDHPARVAEQLDRWQHDLGADPSVWIEAEPATSIVVPGELHARLVSRPTD